MTKLIAGLSTIPGREEMVKTVIRSLYPQVDALCVHFDNYQEREAKKIAFSLTKELGPFLLSWSNHTMGDAAKFSYCFRRYDKTLPPEPFYFFSCDDDLEYLPGYIHTMKSWVDRFDRQAVISLHGSYLDPTSFPLQSYYQDRIGQACLQGQQWNLHTTCPGTGVMAFHSDTFLPQAEDFPSPNMADIWAGIALLKARIPVVCPQHIGDGGEVRYLNPPLETTIWAQEHQKDERQTAALNQLFQESPALFDLSLQLPFPNQQLVRSLEMRLGDAGREIWLRPAYPQP